MKSEEIKSLISRPSVDCVARSGEVRDDAAKAINEEAQDRI